MRLALQDVSVWGFTLFRCPRRNGSTVITGRFPSYPKCGSSRELTV